MKFSIYSSVIILSVLFTSCTEIIDLTLDDPAPVLVVDGYLTNQDTTQWVRLSSIENYFADDVPDFSVFKDSKVYLIENGTVADTYSYNSDKGRFEIQFQGTPLNNYQVDITLPDGERYISSEELMETPVLIDSIWFDIQPNEFDENTNYVTVYINTKEPAGLGDNYQWKSFVNDEYQFEAFDLFFSDDRFVDGQDIEELDIFSMNEVDFDDYFTNASDGRAFVKIEQTKISYRYFEYLSLVAQQLTQIGSPFAAPPAEIRGNVYKQGENEVLALGYFYTSSIDAKTVEVIK